ncbi:FAD-binding domain-containing protein, partial [Motilimonas sp. KMU-193]|uniref:FAD-binding domain-containing protein n=1 Tax=Motilimonas sp. KMU-193 TaxID=3388668 RepID=UPI00396B1379
ENEFGANESTYWLGFELWWREYFQWLALQLKTDLYRFQGRPGKAPLTSYFSERFVKWCLGQTPFPLVNACMKQLNQTGYMSNRGRQIVASCLVNELGVDWRYGAAYFQQQLADHDVASNWGNWQYIAGVGVDPRGGRHFNLAKQTQTYDLNGDFVAKWQGASELLPLDSVDAADWPVVYSP